MHKQIAFPIFKVSRRTYVTSLLHRITGLFALSQFEVQAATSELPAAISLPNELEIALKQKEPLIVMVSLAGCPYCRMARNSYLGPMQKQGFPIVQVDMRSNQQVKALNGQFQTHDQLVKQWRVSVAPTLLFIGPQGNEIVDRMEGGFLPDFYGAYLDERITAARKILRT